MLTEIRQTILEAETKDDVIDITLAMIDYFGNKKDEGGTKVQILLERYAHSEIGGTSILI